MTKKQENTNIDSKEFGIAVAKIAIERNCTDVVLMDLRGKSPATDYYLIATGTSNRQIRTVADEITEMAKENKWVKFGQAGYDEGRWVLQDYVDVVIHLFDDEYRDYYDLEMLWGDAKQVPLGIEEAKAQSDLDTD